MKMTEKELIAKLQELKQIKPNPDWVVLTKNQILGEPDRGRASISSSIVGGIRFLFQPKPVLATVVCFGLFIGIFVISQNSLPGDRLYSIKKITETARMLFVSEQELPMAQLELANKRLEELNRVAQENRVENLAPAISETRASISEAAKNLARASSPAEIKKIVDGIEEKAETISQALGVAVGQEELGKLIKNSDKLYLEYLILDLRTRTLTLAQKEILRQMEDLVKEGGYSQALILFHNEFNKPAVTEPAEEIKTEEITEDEETEEKL